MEHACCSAVSGQAAPAPTSLLLLALLQDLLQYLPVVRLEAQGFHRAESAHNSCYFAIWSKSIIHLSSCLQELNVCWCLISPAVEEPLCRCPGHCKQSTGRWRGQGRLKWGVRTDGSKVESCVLTLLLLCIHQPCLFLAREAALLGECHSCEGGCFPGELGVAHPGQDLPPRQRAEGWPTLPRITQDLDVRARMRTRVLLWQTQLLAWAAASTNGCFAGSSWPFKMPDLLFLSLDLSVG